MLDIQLVDGVHLSRGRGRESGGRASPVAIVMTSSVLEADVRLRGIVDAVRDRYHGNRADRAVSISNSAAR